MSGWSAALAWLEGAALGSAVRGAGVWAYALINLLHILGIATLFGSILILDLRLLGWRRDIPVKVMAALTIPTATVGFSLAAVSGLCLLSTNATEYADNPFLLIKFGAIALGLLNVFVLRRLAAWQAAVSLACWLTAIGAGRMIGYW